MSFSGWIERMRQKKHDHAYQRHRKHIKNRFGQGEDRSRAIQFFKDLGGTEGCQGLLERFMVNVEPSIKDEEEKQDVFDILVGFGNQVIPAVETYLNRKDSASVPITWPLKVLSAVAEPEEAVEVIKRALDNLGTSYTREPERKVLLVSQLAEYDHPDVVPALIPFLRDHRDEVQLEALTALTRRHDDTAREAVLQLLVDDDTPARLRAAVADSMSALGWTVKGYRKKVEAVLPEGMHVDRSGRIKGRWKYAVSESDDEEG